MYVEDSQLMFWKADDVRDVKDRSNTPKGCNVMYVGDVEDVKDRSNTPKGCNAMYVIDVKDRCKGCNASMSKIDQIHLRAVMLCMLKMSKMSKIIFDIFDML